MPQHAGLTYEELLALGAKPGRAATPQVPQAGKGLTYEQLVAMGATPFSAVAETEMPSVGSRMLSAVGRVAGGIASLPSAVMPKNREEGILGPGYTAAKRLIAEPMVEQWKKAAATSRGGETLESLGHRAAAALPGVGPWAASMGERAGTGDIAGAATELVLGLALPKALQKARLQAVIESAQTLATQARKGLMLPSAVRNEWAPKALKTLKEARTVNLAEVRASYPKVKVDLDTAQIEKILPEGEKVLPGIRAAREKLDMAGLNEEGIRNARSELWTYRKRQGLPTDEWKAYGDAYGALTAELRQQYAAGGKLPEFVNAEKNFGVYMETFHGPKSPVAKALRSELPASGLVEGRAAARALSSQVGKQQLEALGKRGLSKEASWMMESERYADPSLATGISFSYRVPILRQAIEFLITRPQFYPSLRK